ncbi:hypothetical protein [Iodobacter fluviatilis]|uniref:Uncharacterized protein n=1 Tax=Iodobacter fluviatilis TaxID=537 RepID=A0A377Q624_9NEIS|nr:hypothetical protein [Iodobacter fluviatilis]TCU84594.1 hypothetical protein EV682_109119 [Iodobacter fluviatilis]STQ90059.1 Uncharacterised protein [Iodobacter fluviatilis]
MTIHSTHPDLITRIHSNVLLIKAGYDVNDPDVIDLAYHPEQLNGKVIDEQHKSLNINALEYYLDHLYSNCEKSNTFFDKVNGKVIDKMCDNLTITLIIMFILLMATLAVIDSFHSKEFTFIPVDEVQRFCFSFETSKPYTFSPGGEYTFNGKNYRCEQVANFYQWIPIDSNANN